MGENSSIVICLFYKYENVPTEFLSLLNNCSPWIDKKDGFGGLVKKEEIIYDMYVLQHCENSTLGSLGKILSYDIQGLLIITIA